MQFHRQLNRHVPALGEIGDCFRTCIACFLNLHPSDVPHFSAHFYNGTEEMSKDMEAMYQKWLAERGLTLIDVVYAHKGPPQELCDHIAAMNGEDFTYMLLGRSITSTHVCIYRGSALLWDPANSGGLTGDVDGYYWMKILASLRCRTNPLPENDK